MSLEKNREIIDFLKQRDIKASFTRVMIYSYLLEKKNHPTVSTIHNDLKNLLPTLSKTTVYQTLSLFEEKNIVSALTIEDNELRYDANTMIHGHFKCEKCGEIYDFSLNTISKDFIEIKGFKINTYNIYLSGICINCS